MTNNNNMSESSKWRVINAEVHCMLLVVKVEHLGSMTTEMRIKVS